MRVSVLRSSGVAGLAAAGVLAAVAVPASAATTDAGEGSAYGASASVSLLPGVLGDGGATVKTGRLAPSASSGDTSASIADVPLKGIVTAQAIRSSAEHGAKTGGVTSDASIVDAKLPVLAGIAGKVPTASLISAQCESTADGVTGSSKVVGLDLGKLGQVPVAAKADTALGLPGVVQVIVNEQVRNSDGSLTVNALHLKLLGGQLTGAVGTGDIVLSSATCAKAAAVTTPAASTPPAAVSGASGSQVSVVPAGAPQTGDGTLATEREG